MLDWLRIIAIGAIPGLFSGAGILVAIFVTGHKEDALRGGALGTAAALIFLFINRNYGMKLYDAAEELSQLAKSAPGTAPSAAPAKVPLTLAELESKFEALRAAILVDGDELKKLNWCLAITTAFAAFVCAFGDSIAEHFINQMAGHN